MGQDKAGKPRLTLQHDWVRRKRGAGSGECHWVTHIPSVMAVMRGTKALSKG